VKGDMLLLLGGWLWRLVRPSPPPRARSRSRVLRVPSGGSPGNIAVVLSRHAGGVVFGVGAVSGECSVHVGFEVRSFFGLQPCT
jgi:hypothetical protein